MLYFRPIQSYIIQMMFQFAIDHDIMRTMGIPEPMIPILKEQMREAMKTPEFWQQYKAANPTVDTSQWPKEIQERFNKKMKGN